MFIGRGSWSRNGKFTYMNFLETYRDWAKTGTDAPDIYHEFMGLAVIGMTLGNRVFTPFGHSNIATNMWIVFLGPSGNKKSTAQDIGKYLLLDHDPAMVYASEFSHEGILKNIQPHPYGGFFFDEFKNFTALMGREYNSQVKGFFTEIYSSPSVYKRQTTLANIEITRPAISIMSCSTPEWFVENAKTEDIAGGLYPRFMYVFSTGRERNEAWPEIPDNVIRRELLTKMDEFAKLKGPCSLTKDALACYRDWYQDHKCPSSMLGPYFQRSQTHLIKMAMVLEINNSGGLTIQDTTIVEAISYLEKVETSLKRLYDEEFSFTKFEAKRNRVKKLIRENEDFTRGDLMRYTKYTPKELNEILSALEQSGEIHYEQVKTGTKPKIYIRLANEIR